MTTQAFVQAIHTLMTEICDGPPNPKGTWITSNQAGSGILGTVAKLSPGQAAQKFTGHAHSIAGHTAHVRFSLDLVLRRAHGEVGKVDWEKSFHTPPLDDKSWQALQASLRDVYERVIALPADDKTLSDVEMITGYIATVAHTAYHLGAIRTLVSMLG